MKRLALSHVPSPLFHHAALDGLVGTEVWVKQDDSNAGPASGNKIRKLEFLVADAQSQRADVLITCGGEQSNHARATALVAARLGMKSVLMLRTLNPEHPPAMTGNLLLDRLAGASIRFISPDQYAHRDLLMLQIKNELGQAGHNAYVIPEGGSNGIGALGWVRAMQEVRGQLDLGLATGVDHFDAVVVACGSGGTAAGCVVGAAQHAIAESVIAMAVCDDSSTFLRRISSIVDEIYHLDQSTRARAKLNVYDDWKGPAYAVASREQLQFIKQVAETTGLILDPVYTGKALYGLSRMPNKPARALFLHTGGLPGLLAQCEDFSSFWT